MQTVLGVERTRATFLSYSKQAQAGFTADLAALLAHSTHMHPGPGNLPHNGLAADSRLATILRHSGPPADTTRAAKRQKRRGGVRLPGSTEALRPGQNGLWPVHRSHAQPTGAIADSADAVSVLMAGAGILTPVLAAAGFTFHLTSRGHSSGGDFATGRFTKGTQYLELHFRHSLGWSPMGGTTLLSRTPTICADWQ